MNRPHITTYSVASLDGRLTLAPDCLLLYGDPRWQAADGSGKEVYQAIYKELP